MKIEKYKMLLRFKNELLEEFDKHERQWHCNLCDKTMPSGAYCVERHFDSVHGITGDSKLRDHEKDWKLIYLDRISVKKCTERVYIRNKRSIQRSEKRGFK